MSIKYEKILTEDVDIGVGEASRTSPGGGTMVGSKVNPALLLPEFTQTEIDELTVSGKAMVWNTTTEQINFYDGSAWREVNLGML